MLKDGQFLKYNIEYFRKNLQNLAEVNTEKDGNIFLFVVGDGNHSLATAKATWEEYKKIILELKIVI